MEWYKKEKAELTKNNWAATVGAEAPCPRSIARTVCVPATSVYSGAPAGVAHIPADTVTYYDNYDHKKWTRYDVSSFVKSLATAHMAGYVIDHHPGGVYELRYESPRGYGQQCVYDKCGRLITSGPGAGSVDKVSPNVTTLGLPLPHYYADVQPFVWALRLDGDRSNPNANSRYYKMYAEVRPTKI